MAHVRPRASADAGPSGTPLPTELTRFIGRERELAELLDLLADTRLLTLTGAAGSGKTRLALALAGATAGDAAVSWVELAPLRDPGLVVRAVAEGAGLRDEVGSAGIDALVRLLAGHRRLLVLDNCEHLVDACAAVVDALLRGCDGVSVLATSREALGVRGERAWLVPPLALPAPDSGAREPGAAEEYAAIRLFADRARDVVLGFALTPENTGAVVEICRRLDGIPLAIELAAARVRVLSPQDIRARLDDVFHLLPAAGRTAIPRHRTLRAAIDWSYDLLADETRTLLGRLSVFRGGFDLDGAERVGAGGDLGEVDVLDLVARLVDRSLLGVGEHHGATRYTFLEAVRQYAAQKLTESGEEPEVRARHARWMLERVQEAEPHFTRTERRVWVDRLQGELDNLRSALAWSRDHQPGLHLELVGRLWWFWFSTRHWTEGGRWIDGALALPEAGGPTPDRARLLFAAGALAALQVRTGDARPLLEEAADLAVRQGDHRLEAYALNYLGLTYAGEGVSETAIELCARAERWFRDHDDLYGLRLAALLQGSAALGRDDLEEAEAKNREGVRVARLFGQNRELAVSLQNLAAVYLRANRPGDAEPLLREAMAASLRDPSYYFIATGVAYMGEVAAARGDGGEAARLLGAAEAIRDRIGARPFPLDARRQEAATRVIRATIGDDAFDRAWADGQEVDPDRLVAGLAAAPTDPGSRAEPGTVAGAPDGVEPETRAAPVETGESAPAGVPELRLEVLGPPSVFVDGVPVDPGRWVYAKPRELLLYLAVHPRGAPRDQIGEALWPGASRSKAKNNFHVTLHHLRKALGHPEWVVTEGDRYRLDPGLTVRFDAAEFEEGARAVLRTGDGAAGRASGRADPAELRRLLSLYRGELAEGEPVGRWIDDSRDRLHRLQVELSLALGAVLDAEAPAAAADLYHQLAAREELDEEVHRRLMRAWARAGNRPAALRHYDRVVDLLRSVLDAEPEPETVAAYEEIRDARAGLSAARSESPF